MSGAVATAIQDAEARLRLQLDLQEVCAAKGFDIEYQPQVDLRTGRVKNFEALLRWRHPVRGNVPPAQFIPLAEEIGLIADIGEWVLRQACRAATSWPDDIGVAVNVSAIQLTDVAFPAIVATALSASGLAPSRLELEVTETKLMPDDPGTLAVLREIRDFGVGIVMDDFDTGYSALGYLLNFPLPRSRSTDSLSIRFHRNSTDTRRPLRSCVR